jgi:hypothetical protein
VYLEVNMAEDPRVYVYPDWLRAGIYLRDRSPSSSQAKENYWVKSIESGEGEDTTIVRLLRISLGDTLRLTVPEVLAKLEPTGRNSSLPPRVV